MKHTHDYLFVAEMSPAVGRTITVKGHEGWKPILMNSVVQQNGVIQVLVVFEQPVATGFEQPVQPK